MRNISFCSSFCLRFWPSSELVGERREHREREGVWVWVWMQDSRDAPWWVRAVCQCFNLMVMAIVFVLQLCLWLSINCCSGVFRTHCSVEEIGEGFYGLLEKGFCSSFFRTHWRWQGPTPLNTSVNQDLTIWSRQICVHIKDDWIPLKKTTHSHRPKVGLKSNNILQN